MAKAKRYFIRTEGGQKGPYTLAQMKASLQAKTLSSHAEYRTSEDEEWQPVKRLVDRFGQDEADKRVARAERAAEAGPVPGLPRKPEGSRLPGIVAAILVVPAALGWMWWSHMSRMEALGKPCHVPGDCPSGMSCLLTINEDRSIQAEGYCTIVCKDSSDCNGTLICGEAIQTDSAGAKWDGMIRHDTRMCQKR